MTSEFTILEVDIRAPGTSMAAVADQVIALLESGEVQLVDFAVDTPDDSTIRAVGHPRTREYP